eukprot:CAMPEP_0170513324 /NCGR_PEP_ID=MMETSP0208-20121228/67340_1 /TAXON_ID=197538 /ORGANISM="Strombidium inclinatum, Strain S3" /LENGTH=56 /DNA_ID=CAMNT_0010797049 /DNA_START=999 /DNA_END=1169 /DNA_ORIENTATION=-
MEDCNSRLEKEMDIFNLIKTQRRVLNNIKLIKAQLIMPDDIDTDSSSEAAHNEELS